MLIFNQRNMIVLLDCERNSFTMVKRTFLFQFVLLVACVCSGMIWWNRNKIILGLHIFLKYVSSVIPCQQYFSKVLLLIVFCYERCRVENTEIESVCNCRRNFEDFSSSCEVFMEPRKGSSKKEGIFSCKSNASQRCKDKILEIAKMWENAPNAKTCKDEDPQYNSVMELARNCTYNRPK